MPESGNIQETKSHKRMNDTELRKKQILKAATDLFMENGYQGVNIDVIAEKCGIVRGTVLRYFGSKRELYNQPVAIWRATIWDRSVKMKAYL